MGHSNVMALLLCLYLVVPSLLGSPVKTEARMRVAFSSSSDIDDDHYFPPPTEEGSRGGWKRTVTPVRRPPLVPRSPVGSPNKPYVQPFPPPPPIEI
jgi:hypothetical protein